jgi:hypothetical protein
MDSKTIYEAGYAIPTYDCMGQYRYWKYQDRDMVVAPNSIRLYDVPGCDFLLGRIEDVRANERQ